jgi:hypothetical protein
MRMNSADRVTPPLLCNGDRMNQREFHRRYEAYPDDVKFELIGGIVFIKPYRKACPPARTRRLSSV